MINLIQKEYHVLGPIITYISRTPSPCGYVHVQANGRSHQFDWAVKYRANILSGVGLYA